MEDEKVLAWVNRIGGQTVAYVERDDNEFILEEEIELESDSREED